MGQLRSSARALLINGAQPALLLEQLDSAASLIPNAYCTTVFLAVLDTETGVLEYSNAGHMPAVLAGPKPGQTVMLTDAASVPLAVRREQPRPQASQVLPPGSTLMLYTDGLVERKRESIDDGISRAARILMDTMTSPLEAVPEAVVRALAPASGYDDDVAMVVYRHRPAKLRIEIEAAAGQLAVIRHRLAAWLQTAGVPDQLAADIVLVVNEACTNCAEHAYRGHTAQTMLLEAEVADRQVRARITDAGSWKTPAADPGNSGRGLVLMRALSDALEIHSTTTGTTVDVGFQLPGQAK
jgi:anti-sigma regulatory factor (Ser/Thr protein kinase)